MQLFARNHKNHIVAASHASRQADYVCLECNCLVRLRGGVKRKLHFYHVDPERPCRQHGKTIEHLQVQTFLKNLLPDSSMEVPFPKVKRIADLVWFQEKIIFEVQYSPITAEEVKARNADYASLGYQVVWILHESRFNRDRLSAAELSLRLSPHYFTNMNAEGQGMIYDQYDCLRRGQRKFKKHPLPVDLSLLKQKPQRIIGHIRVIHQRLTHWPFHFAGDLLDHLDHEYVVQANAVENAPVPLKTWKQRISELWYYCVVRPYKIGFRMILERASR